MRVGLTEQEFRRVAYHLDMLRKFTSMTERYTPEFVQKAADQRRGMVFALDALGFAVIEDESGKVIDIAQR